MHGLEPSDISVLLLEDDQDSLNRCRTFLDEEGYQLQVTNSIFSAKEFFKDHDFHILFIHVAKLPSQGLEFCQWVRRHSVVPIVMLTDRNESVTEAMAIEAGADDYIVRPVTKKLMMMRIAQQLDRSGSLSTKVEQFLHFQNLTLGLVTHQFTVGENDVTLTATEFLIIRIFMKQPERVFTREQILDAIGIGEGPGTDHIINSHISRLRIKIRNNGGPEVISVVRNMGYKFTDERKSKNFKLVSGEKVASFKLTSANDETEVLI